MSRTSADPSHGPPHVSPLRVEQLDGVERPPVHRLRLEGRAEREGLFAHGPVQTLEGLPRPWPRPAQAGPRRPRERSLTAARVRSLSRRSGRTAPSPPAPQIDARLLRDRCEIPQRLMRDSSEIDARFLPERYKIASGSMQDCSDSNPRSMRDCCEIDSSQTRRSFGLPMSSCGPCSDFGLSPTDSAPRLDREGTARGPMRDRSELKEHRMRPACAGNRMGCAPKANGMQPQLVRDANAMRTGRTAMRTQRGRDATGLRTDSERSASLQATESARDATRKSAGCRPDASRKRLTAWPRRLPAISATRFNFP